MNADEPILGARRLRDGRTGFRVWAPRAASVEILINPGPDERRRPLSPEADGYYAGFFDDIPVGTRYRFILDGDSAWADPASRWQPEGVFGPSAVTDPERFTWHDEDWKGIGWDALVFYELHVGTFTPAGTFSGVINELPRLADLGITALELMPVAQFSGGRNWGYDGVFPFAPQNSYGPPESLARLVDRCHREGMAVLLDVVYNHMGPEGNVLPRFGPYFDDHYRTPWGSAMNVDGPESDQVRAYFLQNARDWLWDFHFDGLRLDAVHAIIDTRADPFLAELNRRVTRWSQDLQRPLHTVAESNRNDPREIVPVEQEGLGFSGQWNDDFHHALHAFVTRERQSYYQDFGPLPQLERAISHGYVYSGQFSPYRRRRHGRPLPDACRGRLVHYAQNHDQIGNRPRGDRLAASLPQEALAPIAALVALTPGPPLLFMGEEYGERAPFPYFIDHHDPELVAAVRRGRLEEWSDQGDNPLDPADPETFWAAKLGPVRENALAEWTRSLLALRRRICSQAPNPEVSTLGLVTRLAWKLDRGRLMMWINWDETPHTPKWPKNIRVLLDSETPESRGTFEQPLARAGAVSPHGCLIALVDGEGEDA